MRSITTISILLTLSLLLAACQVAEQLPAEPIPSAQTMIEVPTRVVAAEIEDIEIADINASEQVDPTAAAPTEAPTEVLPTNTPAPTVTAAASPVPPTPVPTLLPTVDPSAQFDSSALRLFDFDETAEVARWIIVNDTVMGGVSTAFGSLEDGNVLFEGDLSLDNNGGFTSMRGPLNADLSDFAGLRLRVRGDGRSYFLRLRDFDNRSNGVEHEELFVTQEDEWAIIEIPFSDLDPVFRGTPVNRPPLDSSRVLAISFMLREKDEGPFRLEIDWIEAYSGGSVAMR